MSQTNWYIQLIISEVESSVYISVDCGSILIKGQIMSECIYEIIDFTKYHRKNLIDFCPGRFYSGRFYRLGICYLFGLFSRRLYSVSGVVSRLRSDEVRMYLWNHRFSKTPPKKFDRFLPWRLDMLCTHFLVINNSFVSIVNSSIWIALLSHIL